MIEETGRVVGIEDGFVWVETEPASACGSCSVRGGCGTSVLAGLFGRRAAPLRLANRVNAAVGDRVVIGIEEAGLVRGSLAIYMAPLAGLFGGALLGRLLAGDGMAELASIAGALAGLVAGLAWLQRFSRRTSRDARYQPVILRVQ